MLKMKGGKLLFDPHN